MNDAANEDRRFLTVEEEAEGTRVDRFIAERVEEVSRSRIQKLIREGRVLLAGRTCKASASVTEGQVVSWPADADVTVVTIEPEPIPLQVLLEDDDLLVLHKPPGLVVHPAPGHWCGTLVNALLHRWPDWRAPGGAMRPGIVQRLDKDTSGLMVVARSGRAYRSLREQLAAHEAERAYIALVWGAMDQDAGLIDRPIGRDPRERQRMAVVERGGRPATTGWRVLSRFDSFTLLRLVLQTGRTHQIRVHLASIGHPVFGDTTYGGDRFVSQLPPRERPRAHGLLQALGRFALHAYRLGFRHPGDGADLVFEAPVPEDMEKVLLELAEAGGGR